MSNVTAFPPPYSLDQDEIDAGRMRAGQMYSQATSDAERKVAIYWFQFWQKLNDAAKILRQLGAA